ncbi:hypothetical protein Syun_029261 [Stephania yunnanensis]|uniref:Lipoyl-binding domain-containing protein n=1 Tax=Stephania yunnanensis TaxID=152371 RepID=A0AAP0E9L9_9MAGN
MTSSDSPTSSKTTIHVCFSVTNFDEFVPSLKHVVKAPRFGCVHQLKVNTGQQVFDNNVLFVIEYVVKAPHSGRVHQLKVNTSQQVFDNNVLFVIKIASPSRPLGSSCIAKLFPRKIMPFLEETNLYHSEKDLRLALEAFQFS